MQEINSPAIIDKGIDSSLSPANTTNHDDLVPPPPQPQEMMIAKLLDIADKEYSNTNFRLAFQLFSSLMDLENTGHSLFMIGIMYKYGQGTEIDNDKKRMYIDKALPLLRTHHQRITVVCGDLGFLYNIGEGVSRDLNEAFRLCKLSADQGNSYAQNNLAFMYENGEGVSRDLQEAFRLFKLSADQGNSTAQYNLAYMYKIGKGVSRDLDEALRLYKLSADQGNSKAQYNLASMYEHGHGVPRDLDEALRLYKLSADQGNSCAQNSLKFMVY